MASQGTRTESVRDPDITYSTSGPPCWDFIEDIYLRKVERRQQKAKENFAKFCKFTRAYDKQKYASEHDKLVKLIGPVWFQELSSNQMRTVEGLRAAILKDVKQNTICHTQFVIAQLGIILRPYPKHVEKAIKQCCNCPVEFLLILYQLMNRKRKSYSLNDRLLLSSVVHLAMRNTLKELHIRIPSPPPRKPPKPPRKRKKIVREYKSPYLIPFLFKPEPPKHTGVYKNNHVQHPESPYFDYIPELKVDPLKPTTSTTGSAAKYRIDKGDDDDENATEILLTRKQSGVTDEEEKELVAELRVAQREYNQLTDLESAPWLLKPSLYIACPLHQEKKFEPPEEKATEDKTVCIEVTVTTDYDDNLNTIKKTCQCNVTYKDGDTQNITEGETVIAENPVLEYVEPPSELEPPPPPTPITLTIEAPPEIPEETEAEKTVEPSETKHLLAVVPRPSIECKCREEMEKFMKSVADLEDNPEDDEEGEDEGPHGCCDCWQKYRAKLKMLNQMKKRFDVQHDLKSVQKQFVVGGVAHTRDGDPVYMLSGIIPNKECPCLKRYLEAERERKRVANMPSLPGGRQKYLISGIKEMDEGNVYVLSGAAVSEDCPCMKLFKMYSQKHFGCVQLYQEYLKKVEQDTEEYLQELAQDQRYANEESPPTSDIWQPPPECTCCLCYPCESCTGGPCNPPRCSPPPNCSPVSSCYRPPPSCPPPPPICPPPPTCSPPSVLPCPGNSQAVVPASQDLCSACGYPKQSEFIVETNLDITVEFNMTSGCSCTQCSPKSYSSCPTYPTCNCSAPPACSCCGSGSARGAGTAPPLEAEPPKKKKKKKAEPEPDLKRFIIMPKIPCQPRKQMKIIKRALEVLAEDGWPLAKLPEAHKLPHFKLWMQMRCKMFWTQADRFPFLMESMGHWRHWSKCNKRVSLPPLNFTREELDSFTWRNSTFVKKLAREGDTDFYRRLRQTTIGDAREYYPSTFSYEFPSFPQHFRDTFFAYSSAKEEECVCWRPWFPHEFLHCNK